MYSETVSPVHPQSRIMVHVLLIICTSRPERSRMVSSSPRVVLSVTVIVFIVVPFCKERTRGRCSYCVKGTQADDVHTEILS